MISRRQFLVLGALVGVVPLRVFSKARPVVAFHLDAPYLDLTGQAMPYRPPLGARGGEALAGLSEADFVSLML
jgi:hypothetical protein